MGPSVAAAVAISKPEVFLRTAQQAVAVYDRAVCISFSESAVKVGGVSKSNYHHSSLSHTGAVRLACVVVGTFPKGFLVFWFSLELLVRIGVCFQGEYQKFSKTPKMVAVHPVESS